MFPLHSPSPNTGFGKPFKVTFKSKSVINVMSGIDSSISHVFLVKLILKKETFSYNKRNNYLPRLCRFSKTYLNVLTVIDFAPFAIKLDNFPVTFVSCNDLLIDILEICKGSNGGKFNCGLPAAQNIR